MKKLLALMTFAAIAAVAAEVPRKSPEFVIQMLDGKDQLLSKYRGKVVVLEFFSPTCPHCQKTVQMLQKLYTELGPKGFQPIAISAGMDHKPLVPNFIKNFGLTFPVGIAERDLEITYLQLPGLQSFMVPQVVVIDRQGVIRDQQVGGEEEPEMRAKILKYLSAPPIQLTPKKAAVAATKK